MIVFLELGTFWNYFLLLKKIIVILLYYFAFLWDLGYLLRILEPILNMNLLENGRMLWNCHKNQGISFFWKNTVESVDVTLLNC